MIRIIPYETLPSQITSSTTIDGTVSNLTQRVLTAVVAIPLIIALCMLGEIYFFLFVAAASTVALIEYYHLAEAKSTKPQTALGAAAGVCITLSFFHAKLQSYLVGIFLGLGIQIPFPSQTQLLLIIMIVAVAVLTLVELFRNDGSALLNLSSTLFGLLYVSLFFGTFVGIRELFQIDDPQVASYFQSVLRMADRAAIYRYGGFTVVSIFAIIWICDSAAFHFGKSMGKHKLFPRVSPNKSWEGAIFGFLFAVGSAIAAKYLVLEYLPVQGAVIIGMIVGIFGQLGDLTESLLKRDAGVKDSSTLIPGHGGAFDRFDSLLLVSPLVYLYLDFILFS
ncbi:MAG TPA: phosphatidate cytidylyltransferase [Bacteroidota bacterium]|nr:phosphatidate cytidylyltransferase [Bacteroidota bacterium]